jgi:sugar phosphate permease
MTLLALGSNFVIIKIILWIFISINSILLLFLSLFLLKNNILLRQNIVAVYENIKKEILEIFYSNFATTDYIASIKERKTQRIFTNTKVLLWGCYAGLIYSPIAVFVDTWGARYLALLIKDTVASAQIVSFLLIGSIVGTFCMGFVKKEQQNRYIILFSFFALCFVSLILYCPPRDISLLKFCFFSVGLLISGQSLVFGQVMDSVAQEKKALTLSCINTLNMITGMIFPLLIGFFLDFFTKQNFLGPLSLINRMALCLSIVPIGMFFALLCLGVIFYSKHNDDKA